MIMTSRELVSNTILFKNNARLAFDLPDPYGTDFFWLDMTPSPDQRPQQGLDEWGAEWHNIGVCNLGEVKSPPLKEWREFSSLAIPDIHDPRRWSSLPGCREKAGDRFILGSGISIYERVHFIRGLENTWIDIYEHPDELRKLIEILVDMNLVAIEKYSQAGVDGYIFADDWGLQNQLMISPAKWREIWKPAYRRIFQAARGAGLLTFLHSCGFIIDILDDLIEIGLQVIHMDQQENMGLELLGNRFGGRITFFAPVDIQATMAHGSLDDIRRYCHKMIRHLSRPNGGFIPRWYSDPKGAGHRSEAITAMCEEFMKINQQRTETKAIR
jgi:uroporphyrinogen decarboxylase